MSVDDRGFALLHVATVPGAAVHAVVPFIRVSNSGVGVTGETFVKLAGDSATTIPLPGQSRELQVRIERLVLAGT